MDRINWFKELYKVYDNISQHTKPYEWTSDRLGLQITIHPSVFSPAYFTDSEWYAEKTQSLASGKSVLEVGSGTGLVIVHLGRNGASSVAATDINPAAVANTRHNFDKYRLAGKVVEGDIYSGLSESDQYDIIFWNHPFNLEYKPDEVLLRAAFDHNFDGLSTYISESSKHLTSKGRLLLGSANYAHPEVIEKIADKHGYGIEVLFSEVLPLSFQDDSVDKLELKLYEFRRKQ
ncbi:hypothetical protein CL622_08195 [archaeon]|nr:hypothetical protein [archaeon]|tara:strand:+ start:844 stop:1542 length:699 start_codon:yes stop_codon:yes gene_type:complete